MSGHLFVVRGDLLGVACDAILVPSGTGTGEDGAVRAGHVTAAWVGELGTAAQDGFLLDAPDAGRPVTRVLEGNGIRRPTVWAGFTGDKGDGPLGFYTRVVDAFVRDAGQHARKNGMAGRRPLMSERPLVAMPLIGSGEGGRRHDRGGLLGGVVASIVATAAREDVDVILVLRDAKAYAAAQQARSQADQHILWAELTEEHEHEAQHIAARSRDGRLVVFLGAGASMGAGLPSWGDLLSRLAELAGLSHEQRDELRHLEHRDAGRILDQRLRERGGLAEAVAQLTSAERCSLLNAIAPSGVRSRATPPLRRIGRGPRAATPLKAVPLGRIEVVAPRAKPHGCAMN